MKRLFLQYVCRIFRFAVALLTIASLAEEIALAEGGIFTDLDAEKHSYCYDAVQWAHQQRIIEGVSVKSATGEAELHFDPDSTCSRAHIVTFLWRYAGRPEQSAEASFPDINKSAYYYSAVLWASRNKIALGYSDGKFKPEKGVSRGEAITFLWRFAGMPEPKAAPMPFHDVVEGKIYYKAVLWGLQNGITDGVSPEEFSPESLCKRGHIAKYLYQYELSLSR